MIQGKLITLRPAKYDEIEQVYNMGLNTEYMKKSFSESFKKGLESFKEEYVKEYFDEREPYVRGGMMICHNDNPIGFISYGQISDFYNRDWVYHFGTMELDIWMDGEDNCGKGYGVDAINTLSDYLHDTYNIYTFMICPERINPRAIHSYKKAGFEEVMSGKKQDILMEIFTEKGLEKLTFDDGYWSDDSCFMIRRY